MPYAWQSVEEAAVTLGVSTRTLHRRISKGEVETRLQTGRREVLVCLPEPDADTPPAFDPVAVAEANEPDTMGPIDSPSLPPSFDSVPTFTSPEPVMKGPVTSAPTSSPSSSIVLAQREIALANEKVRRTELALAAFQHTSDLLEREAWRMRISARLAWAAVAALAIGVYIAVGWTASKVTHHQANNEYLTQQLKAAIATAEDKGEETGELREKLSKAEQAAARAQGELEAVKAAQVRKPATQPGLIERIAKLWGND
ncbi:MAG TPA: hypothetical protein VEA69_00220 [Tepidisphaeraceae bacterium]|nr:hypothetical protein [Tepidisphaeraceae bacterium]